MKQKYVWAAVLCAWLLDGLALASSHSAADKPPEVKAVVTEAVCPLMEQENIPGMAVGVAYQGQEYVFEYGVASRATGKPVMADTLFEIGSVSKTFTATLAAYAQVRGQLSLAEPVSKYLPALRGSHFDTISVLCVGTHTPGGLPLQVPDTVTNDAQLTRYFQDWQPAYPPGTQRTYSNPSVGLLGMVAAQSLGQRFTALMQEDLFPALGLHHTYLEVPAAPQADYAQGYTVKDALIRMAPGVLAAETYGIKTTAGDLLRFVEANLNLLPLDKSWQRAITETHVGYYQVGPMTQDLIWEQYPYPVELSTLLTGNADDMLLNAHPATKLDPPSPPREDVWINKTGSTNGFATYVAFVPAKQVGVVLLANKRYPNDARVKTAAQILNRLIGDASAPVPTASAAP